MMKMEVIKLYTKKGVLEDATSAHYTQAFFQLSSVKRTLTFFFKNKIRYYEDIMADKT